MPDVPNYLERIEKALTAQGYTFLRTVDEAYWIRPDRDSIFDLQFNPADDMVKLITKVNSCWVHPDWILEHLKEFTTVEQLLPQHTDVIQVNHFKYVKLVGNTSIGGFHWANNKMYVDWDMCSKEVKISHLGEGQKINYMTSTQNLDQLELMLNQREEYTLWTSSAAQWVKEVHANLGLRQRGMTAEVTLYHQGNTSIQELILTRGDYTTCLRWDGEKVTSPEITGREPLDREYWLEKIDADFFRFFPTYKDVKEAWDRAREQQRPIKTQVPLEAEVELS